MARILVAGAGFSGHYAALVLQRKLRGSHHHITVVSPRDTFVYYPSLIWVGIASMKAAETQFPLEPVYKRKGIEWIQGKVTEVFPDNRRVTVDTGNDQLRSEAYDYLILATGPKLNFAATPGLGPHGGHTHSVCLPEHATETAQHYLEEVGRMQKGEHRTFVIGTGHGTCTCQGAAFEYIMNVHNDLKVRGLRDKARIVWHSNEPKLGDFGIDGLEVNRGGELFTSEMMLQALFADAGIEYQIQSHIHRIEEKTLYTETLDGQLRELNYDFAMLLPPFRGQDITFRDGQGNALPDVLTNPAGFVKVDANYGKPYAELDGPDWPKTYQNPVYTNIYAVGIAFAPPGPISQPATSPNGTVIAPAPPRTGYTAELSGKAAALNIVDQLANRPQSHTASMAETPGLCIASIRDSAFAGSAATIAIHPVVRNRQKYPGTGRDLKLCTAEVGLAGAWIKRSLQYSFLYKLQGKPFWHLIP